MKKHVFDVVITDINIMSSLVKVDEIIRSLMEKENVETILCNQKGDYLDISPEDLMKHGKYNICKGQDFYERSFLAIPVVIKFKNGNMAKKVITIFQRYTDQQNYWVTGNSATFPGQIRQDFINVVEKLVNQKMISSENDIHDFWPNLNYINDIGCEYDLPNFDKFTYIENIEIFK